MVKHKKPKQNKGGGGGSGMAMPGAPGGGAPAKARPPPGAGQGPQVQLDLPPDGILAARNHFINALGMPQQVLDLRSKKGPVDRLEVAMFLPPNHQPGPAIFVTVGACRRQMPNGKRFEAVMMVKPRPDKALAEMVAHLLTGLAVYPTVHNEDIGPGAVLKSAEEIRASTGMDALVLLPPIPFADKFARFKGPDGTFVELLWALPVYDEEAAFLETHGVAKFYEALEAHQVDTALLGRAPVDLSSPPSKEEPAKVAKPGNGKGAPAAKGAPKGAKPVAKAKPAAKAARK